MSWNVDYGGNDDWGEIFERLKVEGVWASGDLLGIITDRGQNPGRQDTISYRRWTATKSKDIVYAGRHSEQKTAKKGIMWLRHQFEEDYFSCHWSNIKV